MALIGFYFRELLKQMFGRKIICPHCNAGSDVLVTVFCKVLFITFIPIWAAEKCVDITCQTCNENIDCFAYGDNELTSFSGNLQQSARVKWYYFIGLLPFIAYIAYWIYDGLFYSDGY